MSLYDNCKHWGENELKDDANELASFLFRAYKKTIQDEMAERLEKGKEQKK